MFTNVGSFKKEIFSGIIFGSYTVQMTIWIDSWLKLYIENIAIKALRR